MFMLITARDHGVPPYSMSVSSSSFVKMEAQAEYSRLGRNEIVECEGRRASACARQDSNLWPTAPEAVALSS